MDDAFAHGAKVSLFIAVMLVAGRRLTPGSRHYVAHTGSRELFRLAVLAIALGVAFESANLFDVSLALGAFFAGMVLAESQLSQQAANGTLPLREAFAVLFFVSVGMLFNPAILATQPLAVLATFLIIVLGKSFAAYIIVRAFGHPGATALTISACLAQIGEFSFILIVLGIQLAIVPAAARDSVVAGAILSIVVNPLFFKALDRLTPRDEHQVAASDFSSVSDKVAQPEEAPTALSGPPGRPWPRRLPCRRRFLAAKLPFLVVDEDNTALAGARAKGVNAYAGRCGEQGLLDLLNLAGAKCLVAAIRDPATRWGI